MLQTFAGPARVPAVAAADRPPTLHDVARRAGVHPATVSR
ncbi:MAG: LacI family DNA-binding transcriptional regulator, partial [Acidimicrobiales bacterium]|nr:LacI family DNA-binding transcriptional regulator [Acidimicrobiales bacterium]